MRRIWIVLLVVGGFLGRAALLAHADGAGCDADPVLYWEQVADDMLQSFAVTGAATESRRFAMVSLAMHNTLNAIDPRFAPYPYPAGIEADPAAPEASPEAGVDAAAHEILWQTFGLTRSDDPNRKHLDALYAARLACAGDVEARDAGVALGISVGAKVIAMRASDNVPGTNANYANPTAGPGIFQEDPLGAISMPHIGEDRPSGGLTFVVDDNLQFAPPGPPALASPDYAADYDEVLALGPESGSARTSDEQLIAQFWFEPPPRTWNRIARVMAAAHGGDPWRTARLFSLLNMAFIDTAITCFAAKYTYTFWRPKTAIDSSFDDGNPATTQQPGGTWSPLYQALGAVPAYKGYSNLNRPEYPALQSGVASAAAVILAAEYGATVPFRTWSTSGGGSDSSPAAAQAHGRSYASFKEAAREALDATLYLGAHFRTSAVHGGNVGRRVAKWSLGRALLPAGL